MLSFENRQDNFRSPAARDLPPAFLVALVSQFARAHDPKTLGRLDGFVLASVEARVRVISSVIWQRAISASTLQCVAGKRRVIW